MRLVIAGASGFIGKNLLLKLPHNWNVIALYNNSQDFMMFLKRHNIGNVTAFKCDLTRKVDVERLFERFEAPFDACVYLAAKVDILMSVEAPLVDLKCNVEALLNFLEYFKGNRFIYMSSGAVYDGLKGEINPNLRLNPTLPYAISKYTGEQYVKTYCERKNAFENYVILRFFGAYGPYEATNKIYTKIIKAFYLEKKNEFIIYGDGKNLIDAMYIDDAVRGILKVIKTASENITIDFTQGQAISIENLVKKTAKIFRIRKLRIIKQGIANERNLFYSNPKRMYEVFKFKPTISYEQGITKFAEFLKTDNALREVK